MAAWLYVDGLSLYYGSVRDTPYRWLDLEQFAQSLDIDPRIARIHYFSSADVVDPARQARQQLYLRALRTLRTVKVHEVGGIHAVAELSQRLLADDEAGRFDLAVILTNDGRLAAPIARVSKTTCALMPYRRKLADPSVREAATFQKRISRSSLETSLLPDVLADAEGQIVKPPEW